MIKEYEKDIPPEYRNTPNHSLTLGDFAERVTQETLSFFLIRVANEIETAKHEAGILNLAARTLHITPEEIERELRKYRKNATNERGLFRFLSIGDLYSMTGPTDWLVKPYLDKGSLAMVFGQSGTLKSFVAIDIGLSIATGSDWHGNPVGQGTVFYICGEGLNGIARRLRAWELHNGISLDHVSFFVSSRSAQFLDEASAMEVVTAVDELCDQHGKPVFVIIDTLNRNFGPGDESNTADMTSFVHVIDKCLRIPYGCTALIIHHTGHNEQHRARGAYALHAALDWEYQANRDSKILELKNIKSKDFENLPPICLKSEIITLDWKEDDGEAMTSLILRSTTEPFRKKGSLTGANKIAYDSLLEGIKDNGGESIHVETWRAAAYQANISESNKADSKQKAFKRAQEYLQREGMIETKNDYWKPTQDTGHKEDI